MYLAEDIPRVTVVLRCPVAIPAEIDRCVPCVGCERSRSVAASLLSCGQIRPEMITLDANVIGTVERSQDELIKERHASHAHTDNARHARSQLSGGARGALVAGAPRRRRRWARRRRRSTRVVALETACAYPPYRRRRSGLASRLQGRTRSRSGSTRRTSRSSRRRKRRGAAAPRLSSPGLPIRLRHAKA